MPCALVKSRWPEGLVCPHCGGSRHRTFERKGLRSAVLGLPRTDYGDMRDDLASHQAGADALVLGDAPADTGKNNVSALELKRHLGVRDKTAWLMKPTLMPVMCLREDARRLDGRVEIDDAYLGGELPGGKSGRASENKLPFVVAGQTTETSHHAGGLSLQTGIHQGSDRPVGEAVAVRVCAGGL